MKPGEPSAVIRERVIKARNIQTERFSSLPTGEGFSSLPTGEGGGRGRIHCNAMMTERMLHEIASAYATSTIIFGDIDV